jgi:2-polyprenyl-3-methyl-5-hydroxy-6-metoxy-1,4-benzoquinol methylase
MVVRDFCPDMAMEKADRELLEQYKYESRFQKAFKIERILEDYFNTETNQQELRCLDVGCSIGIISARLSTAFGQVVGVEPMAEAIGLAHRLNNESGSSFVQGDGICLPFPDGTFDVIVCAQVYEHTQDPHRLASEIYRVLKPSGCCFFSGPNRLWPLEYHYGWLCLHWLPQIVLDHFCRWRYGHPYDLILLNYWQLRSLWQAFGKVDYTLRLLYDPGKFFDDASLYQWTRRIPRRILQVLRPLLPNFNWVLVKETEEPGV